MDRLDRARETAGGTHHPVPGGMIETAENLRAQYSICREEQDELAVRSQQRAVAAHEAGLFADELVPVTVPGSRGIPDIVVDRDEHPRPDTTVESLGALRPIRLKARSRLHRHRRQRQRARTTAPRCASSPPATRPSSAVCARCWRCARGRWPASAPR